MKFVKGVRCQVSGVSDCLSNLGLVSSVRNKKGQFFIASAIIIIIMVYFLYFSVLKSSDPDYSTIELADFTYLLNNIQNEYGALVETLLSDISRNGGNPNDALDENLTYFSNFTKNLTAERGIVSEISYAKITANTTCMNASVNITLKGMNSQVTSQFFAVREIIPTITSVVTCTAAPAQMDVRVLIRKEYLEPITGLTASDFTLTYMGGGVAFSLTEEGGGSYLLESVQGCVIGNNVQVVVEDQRKIEGTVSGIT
ncbi:MAG: hypothetical protein ABIF92_03270 [archaeon]